MQNFSGLFRLGIYYNISGLSGAQLRHVSCEVLFHNKFKEGNKIGLERKMMKKGNILIIAKVMLPYTSSFGSCQRMYYLANSLYEKGYNVTIMSEKSGKENKCLKDLEIKCEMYWAETKFSGKMFGLNSKILMNVSRKIFNDTSESFAFQHYLWTCECQRKIFNIIRQKKINTVIISAPYFSVFSLTNKIKRRFSNVKVVLDYRDPWNLWNNEHGISRSLEGYYIKNCDRVVCVCSELKEDMGKTFKKYRNKFKVIYNGYYEGAWNQIDINRNVNASMILEFVGRMSFNDSRDNYRNPHKLIKAFLNICEGRNIELRFIGMSGINNDMKVIERKSKGKIKFIKVVPAQEALQKMAEGDVLITINDVRNQADRYALSGKLFDYLRSDRVIWGIGAPKGALKDFIENNGVGVFSENREEDIEKTLIALYEKWKKDSFIKRKNNSVDWSIYSREKQNEKYAKILDELNG